MFVNERAPIDKITGCPYVTFANEENARDPFVIIPVVSIDRLVHLVPDPRRESVGNYWINWWVTFGSNSYPEDRRLQLQSLYDQ